MYKHESNDGYEERVEQGSDIVFNMLGGDYIDPKTSRFKPGHESRVEVARRTLTELALPQKEIEDSIFLGEMYVREHVKQLQEMELRDQTGLWEQLNG
ncbi:MAG TPA: hypothetical protein VNG32_02810 [Candidatus Dormibacteraeota bacterium]|nr:hypothetical protein [Candidatus Dormibacteraeota bacterium]